MIDVGPDLERMRDYIAGRLTAADQRAFEERLAREPRLVRELELSQRLREGLERLRDAGDLPAVSRRPARRRQWVWSVGLAAMIAGVTLLVWLRPAADRGAVSLSSTAPAAGAAAQFTFIAMRGPVATPVFDRPARGSVELRASRPAAPAGARYRITLALIGAGGRHTQIGELAGLEPGGDALVHAYVDAARLEAGAYELRVQADGDPGAGTEVFGFSLRSVAR
jgi:hypothetical protein